MTPIDWSRVRVVSWDVDGTLYAKARMEAAFRRSIRSRIGRGDVRATARAVATLIRHQHLTRGLRAHGGGLAPSPPLWGTDAYREYLTDWLVPAIASAGPRPDLFATLDAIDRSGRRQVVLSDFLADDKLTALGLAGRFEALFCGEALGYIKPSPALFACVLDRLQLPPDALLHVGDRADTDGAAAAAAGVPCVIVGEDLSDVQALMG